MNELLELLKKEYREIAEAHGNATENGDFDSANKNYRKLIDILCKIREYGAEGESILVSLTKDKNDAVSCWSATHSLPFAESNALAVLKALSKRTGPTAFDAKMVIQQWQNGQLVLP